MRRLLKFLSLPGADRRLIVTTALLVFSVRLALWLLPFRLLHQAVTRMAGTPAPGKRADEQMLARIAWAVTAVSRLVPLATCLTQALAVQVLLGRRGYPANLRLGVARDKAGRFQAHAWVESEGRVVIGGSAAYLQLYAPLPALEGVER